MENEDYVYNYMSENPKIKTASTSFNSENLNASCIGNYLTHRGSTAANSNINKKNFFYGDNLLANSKNQYEKHLSKSYFDALPHDYEISIINASETLAETSIFEADYTIHTNSTASDMSKNLKKIPTSGSLSKDKSCDSSK